MTTSRSEAAYADVNGRSGIVLKERNATVLTDEDAWVVITARDRRFDGAFVYAVETTGIYCRPSCPVRRPRRENVVFYASPQEAEQAGYRACHRCCPTHARRAGRRAGTGLPRRAPG